LDESAKVWMICQQLHCTLYAQHLLSCAYRVADGNEFEQALQILQRSRAYLDARHVRALGGLTFLPASFASRYPKAIPNECDLPDSSASRSDSAASVTKRARSSARRTSRDSASTMNACGVTPASSASRASRCFNESGNLRLVAAMILSVGRT
ncbi:MAG TPA: hypothetical protein PLO41_08860, partial [Rubrivivax sp.]|nr:hypothetical protein [Rubrivivax sp.]